MFDPITLAVGGGLLAVGWITGRISRRRRPEQSTTPQAMCGCGHPLALHDRDTDECHGKTKPIEEMFAPKYLPPAE